MKKYFRISFILFAIFFMTAVFCVFAKDVSEPDYTIPNCTFPDGTIADLCLFKNVFHLKNYYEDLFWNETDAWDPVRLLTKDEQEAWSKNKSIETDDITLKNYTFKEAGEIARIMKDNKLSIGRAYIYDGEERTFIEITPKKNYSSFTYQKIRTTKKRTIAKNVTLPDGSKKDFYLFKTRQIAEIFRREKLGKGQLWYEPHLGISDEKEKKKPKGRIDAKGYLLMPCAQRDIGELADIMVEKDFYAAIYVDQTGESIRRVILVEADSDWKIFKYSQIDYLNKVEWEKQLDELGERGNIGDLF